MSLDNRYNALNIKNNMLRAVFGPHRHAAKRIARLFGVAVSTANYWLANGVPSDREDEINAVLDLELAVQHQRIVELRREIAARRGKVSAQLVASPAAVDRRNPGLPSGESE